MSEFYDGTRTVLTLRTRRRDNQQSRDLGLDTQLYTLTELTALLDAAIERATKVTLGLENGDVFELDVTAYDVLALIERKEPVQ